MGRIVVTGASGFVGRHLVLHLSSEGYEVLALSRAGKGPLGLRNVTPAVMPDLQDASAHWDQLLRPHDVVVHLAGLAHGSVEDERHQQVNHIGTARLAHAAAKASVDRFVFVSSIAAQSGPSATRELTEDDEPRPANAYGRSKLAAEHSVRQSGVPYTILRPVVIYGEEAKGNLVTLQRLAALPIPLPVSGLSAQRSILSIENFNLAVSTILREERARNELFLVADPAPLTIAEMFAQAGKDPFRFVLRSAAATGGLVANDRVRWRLGANCRASDCQHRSPSLNRMAAARIAVGRQCPPWSVISRVPLY